MYGWFFTTIFTVLLIRMFMQWWYKKFDIRENTLLRERRVVFNRNVPWKVHVINGIGYTLKIIFNYELFHVSSFEWFKKRAIEANRQELNGIELNDFGDEKEMNSFVQNYFTQAAFCRIDPSFSTINLAVRRVFFLQAMKERLRIVHQLKLHPEIRQLDIGPPIFIMGLARTGTTLLYNLMALDPSACYPTFNLAINPSLPWNFNSGEPDPRVELAQRMVRRVKSVMVNFDKAHFIDTHAPEECVVPLIGMGIGYTTVFNGKDLAWLKYVLDDADFQQIYEYHRLLAQFLCYKKRGYNASKNHCLFKCPFHVFRLSSLLKVYTNARIIITHRDIKEVVPSFASLMEISSSSSYIDRFDCGRKALQICGILTDILLKEAAPDNNNKTFIHMTYSQLMENPRQAIKNIYAQCQLNYTKEFDEKITNYLQENPQGKHGRHKYSLADYGLSEVELKYRFDSYSKTFLTKKI